MLLNGVLHVRECWPTNTTDGMLLFKSAKQVILKPNAVYDMPVGFSMAIPKGKCLHAICLRDDITFLDNFKINGENLAIKIENISDEDVTIDKGVTLGKFIMLNYTDIQFVPAF